MAKFTLKFRSMSLSMKVFVILGPILLLAVVVMVFVTYQYQEQLILDQARDAAAGQAMVIKASLVNQMIKNLQVDDNFLHQISSEGDIEKLEVLFIKDSLHLKDIYQEPERIKRLEARELSVMGGNYQDVRSVMTTGQSMEVVSCALGQHPDRPLESFTGLRPFWMAGCEHLRIIQPFKAEARCQNCHNVPEGNVLGAAFMNISLAKTTNAIYANAIRSILIFLGFIIAGAACIMLIFRKFVAKPIQNLVNVTEVIGSGKPALEAGQEFDDNEFGRLFESFRTMQEKLHQTQKELVKRERLSTVGQMSSGIIHDFRSPMSVISLAVDVLRKNDDLPDEQRTELFTRVRLALDQMKRMTQELLEFARGEINLEIQKCDLSGFVGDINLLVKSALERKNIRFSTIQKSHGNVSMDRDRMYRAILNLLNNAEDAMPEGGDITLNIYDAGHLVVFELKDSGAGIPESVRETIFEPFVTLGKVKGTGLGLAVTKKIVDEHGGTIGFDSETGKGTTFRIQIPRTRKVSLAG
jgi:signal transduction histidine kinase